MKCIKELEITTEHEIPNQNGGEQNEAEINN